MELTYQQVYPTNPLQARKRIVHFYQQTQNYCETARRYSVRMVASGLASCQRCVDPLQAPLDTLRGS
jgi:hypothetical protein